VQGPCPLQHPRRPAGTRKLQSHHRHAGWLQEVRRPVEGHAQAGPRRDLRDGGAVMSMASASIPEHGFDAWLAHKRSRRVKNWLIVAAAAAVLAWCFKDTILFDTDWARMGGALGIGG